MRGRGEEERFPVLPKIYGTLSALFFLFWPFLPYIFPPSFLPPLPVIMEANINHTWLRGTVAKWLRAWILSPIVQV